MKKYILLSILLVVLDQVTKYYFQGKNIAVNSFFSFTYLENTGVAFGMFQGYNFIWIFVYIAALFIVWKYFRMYKLAWAIITAGIIGNLIDRLVFGFVRDFIAFDFWAVFNLADTYNTIAVILLFYALWKEEKVYKSGSHSKR